MFSKLAEGRRLALGYFHQAGRKLRRWMKRREKVRGITHHHIVGGIDSLQRELMRPTRTLSVNYGIDVGGLVWGCVSELYKANTTSHYSDHSHITVENANESLGPDYRISDATFDAAARLTADVAHRHGFVPSASTVRFHRQFVATACPGPYLWERRDEFIALARRYYDGKDAPVPAKPEPSKPSAPADKTGAALLDGVGVGDSVRIIDWALYDDPALLTGERFVTGTYRITGVTYRYRGGEPVLHLQDSRGGKAWAHYSAVRGVVDDAPAPARKSAAELADEVLAGKWGNGAERRSRLETAGYSYAAVQAAVNAKLAGAGGGKSVAELAREVLRGSWGNGAERRRRLEAAGYDYAAVQAAVNRLL